MPCFDKAPWQELGGVTVLDVQQPRSVNPNAVNSDPLWLSDQPGGFQLSGMQGSPQLKGWTDEGSFPAKVATLHGAEDAQRAVQFARKHGLAVAVKSTGHEWFGRGALPGGGHLELWTHRLTGSKWLDRFTPDSCSQDVGSAVTLGAGVQHWQLYDEATAHRRTVVGGTCSTVGLIGASLGGGYGDYSRMYGSGATNMVEAKVVLADGRVVRASACNEHADLFRALRGGGGGFGVVTEVTYRTYPWMAPGTFGEVKGDVKGDFAANMERLLRWYHDITVQGLAKHFGGKFFVYHDTQPPRIFISVDLKFNGLAADACTRLLEPLRQGPQPIELRCTPSSNPWKPDNVITSPNGAPGWMQPWEPDSAGSYWLESFTRYLRLRDLSPQRLPRTVHAFKQVSDTMGHNTWTTFLSFSLNYGLGGGSPSALAWANQTTVHPDVHEAVGTIKLTRRRNHYMPGSPGHFEDSFWENLKHARRVVNELLPEAGSYFQEGDYSEVHWSQRYWGAHYPELLAAKQKYDPQGFFRCFQCVGSELHPANA